VIVRFATYEEASIYAGVMQADGHFAAILDESTGFMWGRWQGLGRFRPDLGLYRDQVWLDLPIETSLTGRLEATPP